MLSRNQILAADDLPRVEVSVPEWGGSVYVRPLTLAEMYQLEQRGDVQAVEYVILGCVDAAGKQLFTKDDAEALSGKNAVVMHRIAKAVFEACLITSANIDAAKKD
jgi:hypothetical protein